MDSSDIQEVRQTCEQEREKFLKELQKAAPQLAEQAKFIFLLYWAVIEILTTGHAVSKQFIKDERKRMGS